MRKSLQRKTLSLKFEELQNEHKAKIKRQIMGQEI